MTVEEIRDKVMALERRAEREEERHRSMDDRITIIEKTQGGVQDIRLMIERLTMGSDYTRKSFEDLNARLDKLDAKLSKRIEEIDQRLDVHVSQPGEKWEKAKWALFTLALGGVVGYLVKITLP